MKILFFGSKGWIGQQFLELLIKSNHEIIIPTARADESAENEIKTILPDRVISFIGRTYGPGYNTIDYLEDKLFINLRDNLFGNLTLSAICQKYNIHFSVMNTGCIFEYDDTHDINNGFKENDIANFFGSSYSVVKGFADRLIRYNTNALNIRIRMPITDTVHPRNFITKIVTYDKVCSISNSMTVLPDCLPILLTMIENKEIGTINLCNPGTISHNEILAMYKEIVDPNFTWKNFTIEEQNKILESKRSNNYMDTQKLQSLFPEIKPIKNAIYKCLINMKK
jgi:nucleoside-diphosphate-sugar epimerase